MKSRFIVHAIWALAVLGAFLIGATSKTSVTSEDQAHGSFDRRTGSPSLSGNRGNSNRDSNATRKNSRQNASGSSLSRLFGSVSGADIEAVSLQAFRDPNPINRRLAFTKLLESMTVENALDIRAQLVDLGASRDQWEDFSFSWGALAGREAIDLAATTEERDLVTAFSGWAAAKPGEAIAMLENLPENLSGQQRQLTQGLISGIASSDPALASELVLKMAAEGNTDANGLIQIVARQTLLAGGIEEATLWSEGLPDGEVKGVAMNRIASAYVRKDPVAAASWAESYATQDYSSSAIAEIGEEWAERDPVAAVSWLQNLPEGNGQAAGLRGAFGDWEDSDPAAASQYLLDMPDSPQKDASISGFATGYAWQNPAIAIEWAESISDPQMRERSLTRAGQAYLRREPEAARTWLESSNLSQAAKRQVLNGRR